MLRDEANVSGRQRLAPWAWLLWVLISVTTTTAAQYQEQDRPQLHYSPPAHWMNDPNGLVYAHGEYHLFYQYHPGGLTWGPMHWGHAVSTDLVHWKNLPVALDPDEHGVIFSGSAVLDERNTSGLGTAQSPPLVAIYTAHDTVREKAGRLGFQSQNLAYSTDAGRTWKRYGGNPVLSDPGRKDFRDPQVFWLESAGRWIMTVAVGDHVSFFSSADLKDWRHESDFGLGWGAHGGVWECPDLIAMPVANQSRSKFVLLVSLNPGAPNGGSGTQYFVGEFDGHVFKPDPVEDLQARWVDYGPDDYAGVAWNGVPGRTIFLGWMSNWQYAQKVPATAWRGAMTLPRELTLVSAARGLELHSRPIAELRRLRGHEHRLGEHDFRTHLEITQGRQKRSGPIEFIVRLQHPPGGVVELELANELQQRVRLRMDALHGRYELDRSRSGEVGFDPQFKEVATAPLPDGSGTIEVHGFVDRSSLELFMNAGETVMTSLQFPAAPFDRLTLRSQQPARLLSAQVFELKSIWDSQ